MNAPSAPRVLLAAAGAAAVATVGVAQPGFVVAPDFVNHAFLLRRVADGWLAHGLPPLLLDVPGARGDPWLLFYGLGVYVPLAPLAWLVGAPAAIRLGAVLLHALVGWRTAQLAWNGTESRALAAAASVLVLSAAFPISDFVLRGGVVSFFAYDLVALALVSTVDGWTRGRAGPLVQACGAAALGALAHPPTFLLGALFVLPALAAVLWALGPPALGRRRALTVAAAFALCAATLALFLAIVRPALPDLGIRLVGFHHVIVYFDRTFDHPLARLSPLPLDLRDAATAGLPHLSAPVHGALALVLTAAWIAALRARRLPRRTAVAAAVALACFATALALSLPFWPAGPLPPGLPGGMRVAADGSLPDRLLAHVQFAYRLVSALDLLLVLLCALTFTARRTDGGTVGSWLVGSRAPRWLVAGATVLGLAGAAMEAHRIRALGPVAGGERVLDAVSGAAFPPTFYALGTFSMTSAFPLLPADAPPTVAAAAEGDGRYVRALRAECPQACALVTDLVPSRFLTAAVDGRALPRAALFVSGPPTPDGVSREERRQADRARRMALVLPPGSHRVDVTLLPSWMRLVSPAVVALFAMTLAAQAAVLASRRGR